MWLYTRYSAGVNLGRAAGAGAAVSVAVAIVVMGLMRFARFAVVVIGLRYVNGIGVLWDLNVALALVLTRLRNMETHREGRVKKC